MKKASKKKAVKKVIAPVPEINNEQFKLELLTYFREKPKMAKMIYDSIVNNQPLCEILAKIPKFSGLTCEAGKAELMSVLDIPAEHQ